MERFTLLSETCACACGYFNLALILNYCDMRGHSSGLYLATGHGVCDYDTTPEVKRPQQGAV